MKKSNIAVIGSGGREHALSWKLSQSALVGKVYTIPGNGGIPNSIALNTDDLPSLIAWCKTNDIALAVIGPEVPLTKGIVDQFRSEGIAVFGPTKSAARLEGSKSWAKDFMQRYGVSTAKYKVIEAPASKEEIYKAMLSFGYKVVLKFDGLAAGKGVFVCNDHKEINAAIDDYWITYGAKGSVVIEELLEGPEISIIAITDGRSIKFFQPSQDHKRLLDGDRGPNTGGMGAYSPVKQCTAELFAKIRELIVEPTLEGIKKEALDYKGFIYFGILIQENIPYLLEYNVRMGDPETQVLLPSLKSDLLDAIFKTLDGTLEDVSWEFSEQQYVTVALVSGGYPGSYVTGYKIRGSEDVPGDVLVFYSAVKRDADENLITAGGRVLSVVAADTEFAIAQKKAYSTCANISFKDMFYRKDIGSRNR